MGYNQNSASIFFGCSQWMNLIHKFNAHRDGFLPPTAVGKVLQGVWGVIVEKQSQL